MWYFSLSDHISLRCFTDSFLRLKSLTLQWSTPKQQLKSGANCSGNKSILRHFQKESLRRKDRMSGKYSEHFNISKSVSKFTLRLHGSILEPDIDPSTPNKTEFWNQRNTELKIIFLPDFFCCQVLLFDILAFYFSHFFVCLKLALNSRRCTYITHKQKCITQPVRNFRMHFVRMKCS